METNKTATVRGNDIRVSAKQCIEICRFLKNKKIEQALKEMEEVTIMKRAIPMNLEVPHRKGGFSGRYPVKAAEIFIKLLKSLEANANAKNLDIESTRIFAHADRASRPQKPGKYPGRKFKRAHITIIAKEIKK